MTASIARVAPASAAEWDRAWTGCGHATYFHSRQWAEIWRTGSGGRVRPRPLLVTFTDGRRALLPLSVQSSHLGLLRTHLSSPAGTFGGWLATEPLDAAHATLLADLLVGRAGALVWRLNPYDPLAGAVALPRGTTRDVTHVVDLRPGFDAVKRAWTKGHLSAARKAAREGVEVRPAVGESDWRDYHAVYADSLARWGGAATSRYDWRLFEALAARPASEVRLWLAAYRGETIAGALCLYAPRHAVYWHGAALERHFPLRAVNLLLHDAIADACARDLDWFDFNPSGGHDGVVAFKRSFGATARPAPVIAVDSVPHRLLRRMPTLRRPARR